MVDKSQALATALNTLVALTLSFDLVLDFARRARIHDDLRREFCELLAEMEQQVITNEEEYRRLSSKRLKIQVREPSPIEVLNVVCANEELEGRGFDYRYRVTRVQYFFRHFFSWSARNFPKVPAPAQS
jgi:hypothetical protein